MKVILLPIIFLFSLDSVFALEGIIVGLEAPLLLRPNINAKVLQVLRKGQKIYIAPDPRIPKSPLEITYDVSQYGKEIIYNFNRDLEFYQTLTRNADNAFIPISDVKIIYGDKREYDNPITPSSIDPRDYRLEEPLPARYPFSKDKLKRVSINYVTSNSTAARYPHQITIQNEDVSLQNGLKFTWTKKVSFDLLDRFYFGAMVQYTTNSSFLTLPSTSNITEKHREINLGPYTSYDVLRTNKYVIMFAGGITFNRHLHLVSVEDQFDKESRQFSGLSISSRLASYFIIKDIIPKSGTDFLIGAEGSYYTPYSLKSKTNINNERLWNENDQITTPITSKYSLHIGLRARY